MTRLQPDYLAAADRLGWAVALSGSAIAVGAPHRDLYSWQADWGLVVVFRRTASGWATEAELTGWGGHAGFSLALDGDDLAFGAPGYGYGMVHRWHRNPDGRWTSWPPVEVDVARGVRSDERTLRVCEGGRGQLCPRMS